MGTKRRSTFKFNKICERFENKPDPVAEVCKGFG